MNVNMWLSLNCLYHDKDTNFYFKVKKREENDKGNS